MNCPYCGAPVVFTDSSKVYKRSYGMVYVCSRFPECDAYVGAHKGSGAPLGTLAGGLLRRLRVEAHGLFDPLWQTGGMKRHEAYRLMRTLIDVPKHEAHIAMMNEERCKQFITKLREYLRETEEPSRVNVPESEKRAVATKVNGEAR